MNLERFKREIKTRGKPELSAESYGGLSWPDWYKLARKTRHINYGCYFQPDGTCVRTRERKSNNEMCCCSACYYSLGYLRYIQNDPKVIKRIASLFKEDVGFWRKNKGCILPRKYRSAVCLGYRCTESNCAKHMLGAKGILVAFMDSIRTRGIEKKTIYDIGKSLLKIEIC